MPRIERRRPGMLTAMALASLVVACVGAVYHVVTLAEGAAHLHGVNLDLSDIPWLQGGPAFTPADTLSQGDARLIADALATFQPLSDDQRDRLTDSLRRSTVPLAPPGEGAAWTTSFVTSQVVGGASAAPTSQPRGFLRSEEYVQFQLARSGNGSISVYDDRVIIIAWDDDDHYVTTVNADGTVVADHADYRRRDGGMGASRADWLYVRFCAAFAGLAVSMLLLVAAIALARDRPAAGPLHAAWAWLRLLVLVGTGVVLIATAYSLRIPGAGPDDDTIAAVALPILLGVAYPAVVLIGLRTQTARAWFDSLKNAKPTTA